MKNYNQSYIKLAEKLRDEMTPWELKLWGFFLKDHYPKFKRQQVISNYIVDFYCPKARLIIELDGGRHFEPEKIESDKKRDKYLTELGFKVKRYLNTDIDTNFYEVCQDIEDMIDEILNKINKN